MHADDAVLDLAATSQPLPRGTDGLVTTLGRARFIDAADGLGMVVVARHQLLALVTDAFLIPLD
jgi:hypothetical protein